MTRAVVAAGRRIVVTGAAVASPAGYALPATFDAVWQGTPRFAEFTGELAQHSPVRYVGACVDPDAKKLPDRKVQKILRRKDVISLLTILETARSAAVEKGKLDPDRCGIYVGVSSTQVAELEPYFELVKQCAAGDDFDAARFGRDLMGTVNPLVVLQNLMNNSLCFGAMTLDIRGVNANFMDFQAAGLRAVGEAYLSIATRRADHVLAGGVAAAVEPFQVQEGIASGYLARTRDLAGPVEAMVKPYDAGRHGTIMSEGSAYVLLEDEAAAVSRGAPILGLVEGFALAADGAIDIMGAHSSPGLVRAAQTALAQAGASADDLGLVLGHGSGSVHGDLAEARAMRAVLGKAARAVPVVSVKGVLGDLCEASGVVSLIVALESIRRGEAPPTWNFQGGDAESSGLSIAATPQAVRKPLALITARSFLGVSAAVVVRREV